MYNIIMREKEVVFKVSNDYNKRSLMEYFFRFKINKTYINQLINSKKIFINDTVVKNGSVEIVKNDIIKVIVPVEDIQPYKYDVSVIYEDDWIMVVKKPARMLVHSDGLTNETLTSAVSYYFLKKKEVCSAYPIHRLDYETTGIVIFAKNKFSLAYLSVAIENHELEKEYVCLCSGKFSKVKGVIALPIGKDRHSNKQIVVSTGKEAKSRYEVIKNGEKSKVKVVIDHGRKHQIRVHLSHINHPIVGDKLYSRDAEGDLMLHFRRVAFIHPYTQKRVEFICEEEF